MSSTSKYAAKKAAGNQLYGGNSSGGGSCCAHKRESEHVPSNRYWWGELRQCSVVDSIAEEVTYDNA